MKTVLNKKQQNEYILKNNTSFKHKWSSRGYGNSKIIVGYNDNVLVKASGCGYDRFGAVLGKLIEHLFQEELNKIAKIHCKGLSKTRKKSEKFYGLFYNFTEKRAYVDGACGSGCMEKILNKIGFSWKFNGRDSKSSSGVEFYELTPITKHQYKYL